MPIFCPRLPHHPFPGRNVALPFPRLPPAVFSASAGMKFLGHCYGDGCLLKLGRTSLQGHYCHKGELNV